MKEHKVLEIGSKSVKFPTYRYGRYKIILCKNWGNHKFIIDTQKINKRNKVNHSEQVVK